jgi:c-di-GMP-binding flagellar brake protein YcgR
MASGQCRVLDVSSTGAGLELCGPCPIQGIGEHILVRLDPSNDQAGNCELRGHVRNLTASKFGFVRVGVEFVMLRDEDREFLRSLSERQPAEI